MSRSFHGLTAFGLFAMQLALAIASSLVVLQWPLQAVAPLHAVMVSSHGPRAAMCIMIVSITVFVHLLGVFMTLPALIGVKLGKLQVKKVASVGQILKDLPLVAVNCLISIAWGCLTLGFLKPESELMNLAADLPNTRVIVAQSTFCLVATEVVFYHVHRLFHENKRLYGSVHKIHHSWTAPVALVTTYSHPLEHIFCNLLSISVGPALCGSHPAVALAFALIFGVGAMGHHSGYWSDDMGMHDLHHEVFNANYGNAHFLDYLYDTYRTKSAQKFKNAQ